MSERDDYLFHRSGAPDPEVAALERLFAPLRHDGRALPREWSASTTRRRRRVPWLFAAAAAVLVLAGAAALFWPRGEAPLAPGSPERTIVAGEVACAVPFGEVAAIDVAAFGEVRFEQWRDAEIRVRLERGVVDARHVAGEKGGAPALRIATRFGEAVAAAGDAPCTFRLSLEADAGAGALAVQAGIARFVAPARTVVVPAGASVRFTARGPDYPAFDDASANLRKVIEMAAAVAAKRGPEPDESILRKLVDVCGTPRDTLVLWHVLDEGGASRLAGVEERLLELAGPPEPIGKTKQPSWPPDVWFAHLRATAWR